MTLTFKIGTRLTPADKTYDEFVMGEVYITEKSRYGTNCYDFKGLPHKGWDMKFVEKNFKLAKISWKERMSK